MVALVKSRPKAERKSPPPNIPLVEVMGVSNADGSPVVVHAMGTVVPARVLTLQPEVSGRVVSHHPSLVTGGLVMEGEELLRIDDRDYKLAVEQQIAALSRAKLELKTEQGRKAIAEAEWGALQGSLKQADAADRDLALRAPHVKAARAGVQAARAAVDRARLMVERVVIRAPFNAYVRQEAVEIGQLVGPQSPLAILVGTDEVWVEVSVPVAHLSWMSWPDARGEGGSSVTISQDVGLGKPQIWSGRVMRLLEELEPQGRMARVLVRVKDPFGLKGTPGARQAGAGSLLVGAYVNAAIEGRPIESAVQISHLALQEGDRVWVVDEAGKLDRRDVRVTWREENRVLITGGLSAGDRVVISPMVAPVPGMDVQTMGDKSASAGGEGSP